MSELRENFLLTKTNQPEIPGPLGIYSEFSKVLREQPHRHRVVLKLSEKALRELKAMLNEHHWRAEYDCPPENPLQAWHNSDAQIEATMLNQLEKKD